MSNSGKVWDTREAYKQIRANTWSLGSRGLFMGGSAPSASNVIDYIDLNHAGNAVDFGDLATAGAGTQASNSIRAIHSRISQTPIDYVTMATQGNAADFGDMIDSYGADASAANDTRACYVGGYSTPTFSPGWNINRIEYVNIPTLGNMVDFGDLTQGRANQSAGSNGTRGIFAGGYNGGTVSNTDYITMATTGNAIDFGDLSAGFAALSANSPTRLYCAGGQPGATNINYFTFSTLGNSLVWGDLPVKGAQGAGSASHTRGIFQMGEAASPLGAASNRLESISMTASGNSTDFGDLTVGRQDTYCVAAQGHGGIGLGEFQRPSVTYMPGSGRVLFTGGQNPSVSTSIDMTMIKTKGNSSSFGTLATGMRSMSSASSLTRSLSAGGYGSDYTNAIRSVEFASQGNDSNFGDLIAPTYDPQNGVVGNTTRGIFAGGHVSPTQTNVIQYVTIASVSNATDFGDLSTGRQSMAGMTSNTRGVFGGGTVAPSPYVVNTMEYITIASTSNTTDFGDLSATRTEATGLSSSTRGIIAGGDTGAPSIINIIEYITMASTSNTTDFGDLTESRYNFASGSDSITGIFAGGSTPSDSNVLDFITIASTGNAADFGDITSARRGLVGTSDSHGGLQS